MDEKGGDFKKKIEKITKFCEQSSLDDKVNFSEITSDITDAYAELTDQDNAIINALLKSRKGLQRKIGKCSITEAIMIISCVMSSRILYFPLADHSAKVMLLVNFFLKFLFRTINLQTILVQTNTENSFRVKDFSGLCERMKTMDDILHDFDVQGNSESDVQHVHDVIFSFDIHTGVDELCYLRGQIKFLIRNGRDKMQLCLHMLTLFVRISTLRHSLLLRRMIYLKKNNHDPNTVVAMHNFITKERDDNKEFLKFLSVPSLETVCVLAEFDPSFHIELATYLKELRLPLQDLTSILDRRILIVQQFISPSVLLGRPFPSISPARAMNSSIDVDNVRIRFLFKAVENSFNLFYILSPDREEYLCMKSSRFCKYSTKFYGQAGAQWKVIQIKEPNGREDDPSLFVLCTKKQPQKFLYIASSFLGCAKGLEESKAVDKECLFKLAPPGEPPMYIPLPNAEGVSTGFDLSCSL